MKNSAVVLSEVVERVRQVKALKKQNRLEHSDGEEPATPREEATVKSPSKEAEEHLMSMGFLPEQAKEAVALFVMCLQR